MTSLPLTYIDAAATASLEPDDQPLQTSYLATNVNVWERGGAGGGDGYRFVLDLVILNGWVSIT